MSITSENNEPENAKELKQTKKRRYQRIRFR